MMEPLVTAEVMAEIDRRTIEEIGIPGPVLMENAGRGTAAMIIEMLENEGVWRDSLPVTIVAGRGNNGGDGFVIARYLAENGCRVYAFLVGKSEETRGDGRRNLEIYKRIGGEVIEITGKEDLAQLSSAVHDSEIVVDALFGTGLSKEVRGIDRQVIDTINAYSNMVCSVDIPSGVDASTGKILGEAVEADLTCTFGLMKVAHAAPPGANYCGDLSVLDIGFPEIAFDNLEVNHFLVTEEGVRGFIPTRMRDFHKGSAGKVFIIGGSTGFTGAVVMACEGALACGSGLIYAVVPGSLNTIFEQKMTEQMTLPVNDNGSGHFTRAMAQQVIGLAGGADAVAVGPGLSWSEETEGFVKALLPEIEAPVVIDADALNCVSKIPDSLEKVKAPVIVTPHEMEMSRLTGVPLEDVRENRIETARDFSKRHGVIVVLKGNRTVISTPEGAVYINDTGNPYMATGGVGDVLTGMILSFLGQGVIPVEAAIAAVHLHSLSADIACESFPRAPVSPRHIISYYPSALRRVLGYDRMVEGEGWE